MKFEWVDLDGDYRVRSSEGQDIYSIDRASKYYAMII